mgnify:CR=1 FL=1
MENKISDILSMIRNMPEPTPSLRGANDVDYISSTTIEILEYILTDEMQKLEKKNPNAFRQHIEAKFKDFADKYYGVFMSLMDRENRESNVGGLIQMFEQLNDIKKNKITLDEATSNFNEKMNKKYFYDPCGGKEKFEQKIKKSKNEFDENATMADLLK